MYRLIEYSENYRSAWNNFLKEHGTIFHSIEWKEILEEAFRYKSRYFLAIDENNAVVGLVPLFICRNILLRRVGVLTPFANYLDICCIDGQAYSFIIDELTRIRGDLKLDYVEIRLKDQSIDEGEVFLDDSNYTFIIPLEGGEDVVFSSFSGNNRNHIRKALKNGWFSASLHENDLEGFYNVRRSVLKRLGSPLEDIAFFKAIRNRLGAKTKILTVTDNETGKVIGGMFLFLSGETVYYQWGGCYDGYNKKYVNNFMYWEAIKYAINSGYKYLDMGRSPVNSGTFRFKEQWGAQCTGLKYLRIGKNRGNEAGINHSKLKPVVGVWKVLPQFVTDFAGKRLIKYVIP